MSQEYNQDMKFDDIQFETTLWSNRAIVKFTNKYQCSIIRSPISYGGLDGLYEVAVLDHDNNLVYDTPITDDVIGHLSENAVIATLNQVALYDAQQTQS